MAKITGASEILRAANVAKDHQRAIHFNQPIYANGELYTYSDPSDAEKALVYQIGDFIISALKMRPTERDKAQEDGFPLQKRIDLAELLFDVQRARRASEKGSLIISDTHVDLIIESLDHCFGGNEVFGFCYMALHGRVDWDGNIAPLSS